MGVYPRKMDHRLLRIRNKTIKEMRPNYLWDAAYGISVANGQPMIYWYDRMAGRDLVQATADYRPVYLADGMGGYPCVLFDGTNDYMAEGGDGGVTTHLHTVMIAFQCAAEPAGIQYMFGNGNTSNTNSLSYGVAAGGLLRMRGIVSGTTNAVNGNTSLGTTSHVAIFTQNDAGDDWVLYLDGAQQTLTVTDGANTGSGPDNITRGILSVGCAISQTYGSFFAGKIAYIAGWNKLI